MSEVEITYLLSGTDGTKLFFETFGTLYEENDVKILNFIEETEDTIRTKVIIHQNYIELLRSGIITMYVPFINTKETTMVISTAFGYKIEMLTKTIKLAINDNNIYVKYQTEMDKEKNIVHTLDLKWKNKKYNDLQ